MKMNPSTQDVFSELAVSPGGKKEFDEAKNNTTLSMQELKKLTKKVGFYQVNLALVYFLEYMCLTSFADRFVAKMIKKYPERKNEYLFEHGYVIFTFCY
jgi:hypothetical protein